VLDDAELLRRSIEDPELFEEVFERHYDAILRYGRQRVGHDVGEEIAARTMVIAFSRRAAFDGRVRSARPWLYGIATNLLRLHARDERVHITALARLPLDPEIDDEGVVERLDAERRRPALLHALMQLSQADRDAFVLSAVSGLSYAEIAHALGIAEGTAGSRIHRARQRLREAVLRFEANTGDGGGGSSLERPGYDDE
jgi:RNA polymerase sigma factor (sigma-70 family)